jgi:hypothetical protein
MSRKYTRLVVRKKTLPKIWQEIHNGGVYRQLVRCGKRTCRCYRGHPHEAYYLIQRCGWGGAQEKTYIPKKEVERVRDLVDKSRAYWAWVRSIDPQDPAGSGPCPVPIYPNQVIMDELFGTED